MELAILALTFSVISGVGTGICALLYLRQESNQPKESEELLSVWRITKEEEQFLAVKDKKGQIIETRAIEDSEHFDSENVENEVKKVVLSI